MILFSSEIFVDLLLWLRHLLVTLLTAIVFKQLHLKFTLRLCNILVQSTTEGVYISCESVQWAVPLKISPPCVKGFR